jgi:hypothetical protein
MMSLSNIYSYCTESRLPSRRGDVVAFGIDGALAISSFVFGSGLIVSNHAFGVHSNAIDRCGVGLIGSSIFIALLDVVVASVKYHYNPNHPSCR